MTDWEVSNDIRLSHTRLNTDTCNMMTTHKHNHQIGGMEATNDYNQHKVFSQKDLFDLPDKNFHQ